MWERLSENISRGDVKSIARGISYIESEAYDYEAFLQSLDPKKDCPVIGITGPPGAGKSTLTDALIGVLIADGKKKVAVLCIDPSSPFNMGALLGDRIRMSEWYNNPNVYIRSLATRGALGGLHPKIIEITDLLKSSAFDYIIVETVGVGQSEIEIAGLADITIVVMVPESGDEVQTMKAGLMEIADIFVVNKSDRPDADFFVKNLRTLTSPAYHSTERELPVIKTVATQKEGVQELAAAIERLLKEEHDMERKSWLMAEKAYHLIQKNRMRDVDKSDLKEKIKEKVTTGNFQLYSFIKNYIHGNGTQ
ncbi:MAG: methylmalonyl Co-A mutase-associated GTPase MeaB [Terrimonas sp.]|nr:methylmalonyl Co-A mutase-associated GTPase MeaB [Terrimonas sp.]